MSNAHPIQSTVTRALRRVQVGVEVDVDQTRRDLVRLLLERVPRVCLFVRAENASAIRVYEAIGMLQTNTYRSLLF